MFILGVLLVLGGLGLVIALWQSLGKRAGVSDGTLSDTEDEVDSSRSISSGGCCGMHQTCERDSLLSAVSPRIVYYDDEELDAYQGTPSGGYTAEAVDEFREILITLDDDDVAGWVRSLQLRGLEIPEELKPEIYLIVGENRAFHMEHGPTKKVSQLAS